MIQKNVIITEKQQEFIENQSRWFNFSKFVRSKLNEYMEMVENVKERIN